MLTQDQLKAKDALLTFLMSNEKCFVLSGAAGTGKTYLIKHVKDEYEQLLKLNQISLPNFVKPTWNFTATTNKAAEALSSATGTDTSTIHSLLTLRVGSNYETGENFLYRKKDAEPVENRIIVIDEASYIDRNLLTKILENTDKCKLIFMGDAAQLTPVRYSYTPVFNAGFKTASLNQIVRQENSNPIQAISIGLRNHILTGSPIVKFKQCPEILRVSQEDFESMITKEMASPDWEQSKSKVLAWRNKTVCHYNNLIFNQANGRKEFQKGDYVINNHFVNGLKTDEEFRILNITQATHYRVDGWLVNAGLKEPIFVPLNPKDIEKTKNKYVKEGKSLAVKEIMNTWADIRPAYACTINKAQGSTYDKVFIDLDDLSYCKDTTQIMRLLYVAVSRAKHQIILKGNIK